jgi:hypothetical protein
VPEIVLVGAGSVGGTGLAPRYIGAGFGVAFEVARFVVVIASEEAIESCTSAEKTISNGILRCDVKMLRLPEQSNCFRQEKDIGRRGAMEDVPMRLIIKLQML